MLRESISGLSFNVISKIVIVCLEEHANGVFFYRCLEEFSDVGIPIDCLILYERTSSQVETVTTAIQQMHLDGPICIKDCDNYFQWDGVPRGEVMICVATAKNIRKKENKSYIIMNEFTNNVHEVVEKKVVSDLFCCGLYYFKDAATFLAYAGGCSYVSAVINKYIERGTSVNYSFVNEYVDWGTQEDWDEYCENYTLC